MTLEQELMQYDKEQFVAEDAAEEAARMPSKWEKEAWKLFHTEMGHEFNTDEKFNDTATTTTTEEEEEVSTTSEDESDTPTNTGEKDKEVRNMIDDAMISQTKTEIRPEFNKFTATTTMEEEEEEEEEEVCTTTDKFHTISTTTNEASNITISDSTVRTANTASVSKIIENNTTVHTTDNVHTTTTTTDHEFHTTCDTTDKASDTTTMCISSDSTVRTTNTVSILKIIENPTRVHIEFPTATDTVHITNTTRDQEYYSTCTTIDEVSNITTCITTTSDCDKATIDAEYSTDTTTIFDNNTESPTTTTDTTDTNKVIKTPILSPTRTPSKTRNPLKMLADMMTHVFSTITELTNEDIEEYIYGMLLKNSCDNDTREFVRGILKEAMSPKAARVVCDHLFALVDAIEKQERKKQQKQGNMTTVTPPIEITPTNTTRPKTKKTHTSPTD